MNPTDLLNKVKDLIAKGDLNAAKDFINTHKDDLGQYLDQAKGLLENLDLGKELDGALDKAKDVAADLEKQAGGLLDKAKGLFGK